MSLRTPPSTTPRAAPVCPLCGGPNGCAPAACGHFDTDCWCTSARFAQTLLDRIPAQARGQACICRACVEGAHHQAPEGDDPRASTGP